MYYSDVEKLASSSENKLNIADSSFIKYFGRAMMAGIFILLAIYSLLYRH